MATRTHDGAARVARMLVLLALVLCQSSCRAPGRNANGSLVQDTTLQYRVPIEELRSDLLAYARYFQSQVELASQEIEAGTDDRDTRKAVLRWKLQMAADVHEADTPLELIEVLLDTWALSLRITKYFTEGEGKALFGAEQPKAVATATRLQHRIESIAREHLPEDEYASASQRIEEYARENPFGGMFSEEIVEEGKEPRGGFASWLSAPFRAVGKVGESLDPTSRLADSVDRFALFLQDYPAQVRVQTQLLLLQAEELKSVQATVDSLESFAESSAQISSTAEQWPTRFREEAQTLLDDVDRRQPELRATLEEARETSESLHEVMQRAEATSASIERSLEDAARAADAWQATADAVAQAVRELQILIGRDGKSRAAPADPADGGTAGSEESSPKRPFDIQDYQRTANALTESVQELRALVADVNTFVENSTTQTGLTRIDALTTSALTPTAVEARKLVDYIAWRAVQVCALLFILAVVYRVMFRRRRKTGG